MFLYFLFTFLHFFLFICFFFYHILNHKNLLKILFIIMSGISEDPFVTPHDSPEEINLENTKHAEGRPKNAVWQFFEHNSLKHPGYFDAKCKFCDQYWKIGIVK